MAIERAQERKLSTGLLFIDLSSAFDTLVREAVLPIEKGKNAMAFAMMRADVGEDKAWKLAEKYDENTILGRRQGGHVLEMTCDAHRCTYFTTNGLRQGVEVTRGSRMGDSFGMALFGLLYSAVLNEIEGRLIGEGLVESVPRCEGAP